MSQTKLQNLRNNRYNGIHQPCDDYAASQFQEYSSDFKKKIEMSGNIFSQIHVWTSKIMILFIMLLIIIVV